MNMLRLFRIKFLNGFLSCIILSSCIGQEDKTNSSLISQKTTQNATSEGLLPEDQISQVVRMMFQDSKGTIWFGTQNGAFKLTDNVLLRIDNIKSESGNGVTIHDITEGKDGKMWFAHTDGLSSLDGNKVTNYYESDGLINNDVWNVTTDSKGDIWVGTYGGVCKFDGHTFTDFDLPMGIPDTTLGVSSPEMVHDVMEDSKGNIWFCTNAGLFQYQNNTLTNFSEKFGIKTNFINGIMESKKGGYWISTKVALYKLEGDKIHNITGQIPEIGKGIGSMAEDVHGKLWFVINQHYLYTYDGKELVEFNKPEEKQGPVVFQIYRDQDHRLWFVGYGGAFRLENGEFINITKNGPW